MQKKQLKKQQLQFKKFSSKAPAIISIRYDNIADWSQGVLTLLKTDLTGQQIWKIRQSYRLKANQ